MKKSKQHILISLSVTPVKISRQNQRQKQKTDHRTPVLRGRKTLTFFIFFCCRYIIRCVFELFTLFPLYFSRPPKKNFVEVTELTDITYLSNLVKLRPGHMNIVLVLTDASKNVLLSKFAKEVYSFTGWTWHSFLRQNNVCVRFRSSSSVNIPSSKYVPSLLGVWHCISPSWTWTSTASGWTRSWNTPTMPCRPMRTRMILETPGWTTQGTCWHLMATKSTCVCSNLSTLETTSKVSHLRTKEQPQEADQGPGLGPGLVAATLHANPASLVAYPHCRSTTNWTVWVCGWSGSWRALCLVTTSQPGLDWIKSHPVSRCWWMWRTCFFLFFF